MKYYGQYQQDKYLDQLFNKKNDGVFVDIGAHDGVTFSNSLFFEKQRNWKGLCVEPIPEIFQKLNEARTCVKVNGCISEKIGIEKFLRVRGEFVDTEMLSGLVNNYDPRHLERIDREINQYGGSKEEIEVKCFNINELLKESNFNRIDFFTIDTEGNEMSILKTINFDALDIDILLVENNYQTDEMNQFMQSKGYKRIKKIGHDEVYRKNTYLTLIQRLF